MQVRVLAGGLANLALAGVVLVATAAPAAAFLDSIFPGTDTKDEFEGKFIDTLDPGPWQPPLERLAAEQARARGSNAGPGFAVGRDEDNSHAFASAEAAEPAEADEAEPIEIADGLTLLRMDENGVAANSALEAYLNEIGARLIAHSPITGVPLRFYVTSSGAYGRAVALADGAVGIPQGLLKQVDSEDELAFILAHEASHVLLAHHDNDWFQGMNHNLVTTAELGLTAAVAVGQATGNSGITGEAVKAVLIMQAVLLAADKGLFPSFSREQEDEADLLGLDLMIRAGYNPEGASDAMEKMVAWEKAMAEQPDPRAEQRAELEQAVEDSASRGDLGSAFSNAVQGVMLGADEALDDASAGHRDAVARADSLTEYFLREYGEMEMVDSRTLELERVRKRPGVQGLFTAYDSASRSFTATGAGKLEQAEALARKAVSGATSRDSWPRYVFYSTRLRQGKKDKARQNLELALKGPRPSLVIYERLAELYWDEGRKDDAMALLQRGFDEFKRPPGLYAQLIYRHHLLGNQVEANRLVIECRYRNREAGKICAKAALGEAPEADG